MLAIPGQWGNRYEGRGLPVPVEYADEPSFRRWCATTAAVLRPDQVNLRGLGPLLRSEIQWGTCRHARGQHGKWELSPIQRLANYGRSHGLRSLTDLAPDDPGLRKAAGREGAGIASSITDGLHSLYVTPAETREAGYILTEHFGRRLSDRSSHIDLDRISQRWLRDLVWDHFADVLRSPSCPRSGSTFDHTRRAGLELSAFLEVCAPGGGHDPRVLTAGHMHKFAADQRQRELDGLASLGARGVHGKPSIVTAHTRQAVFHRTRRLLRGALESGEAERLGLDRGFITAMPAAGRVIQRSRPPFTDGVARALAAEANLQSLARDHDLFDRGLRDAWETKGTEQEATWRERALNAEDALKAAHTEIIQQRTRIGELLGQVRDLEAEWTKESIQRITTENTTLKQRVRQLTTDNRTLDERLTAARSNLRFHDRRIADLEAQILNTPQK